MSNDPSMEDILASIRRIINEDEPPPAALARPVPPAPAPVEDVLDLVEPAPEPVRAPAPGIGTMKVSGYPGADTTLDALVRSMLAPMLREWLDANLPEIVQQAVAKEISRITRPD